MLQSKQIGKYRKKDSVLDGKAGKKFVTPSGKEYIFNYRKEGRKYIFIITYLGNNMQITEPDFNTTPIDTLLNVMETPIK